MPDFTGNSCLPKDAGDRYRLAELPTSNRLHYLFGQNHVRVNVKLPALCTHQEGRALAQGFGKDGGCNSALW